METIPLMTAEGFAAMEKSVASECKDLPPETGIAVALWRLQELLKGYRYALSNGYQLEAYEERETNP